jgi:hypothetical protein
MVGEPAGCEPAVAKTLERRYDSSPCVDRGQNCIALDGDKLKPREDQRKGGNGFGINEEGAGYTLTGVDRHGVAYGIDQQGGKGGANSTEGVAPTVLSDSHETPHGVAYGIGHGGQGGSVMPSEEVQPTLFKSDHKDPMPAVVSCYENDSLKHSEVCRTLTGNHDDRVTDTGTSVVVSTNSNGEDVAPTLNTSMAKLGGDNQTTFGGGYVVSKAKEGAEGE